MKVRRWMFAPRMNIDGRIAKALDARHLASFHVVKYSAMASHSQHDM